MTSLILNKNIREVESFGKNSLQLGQQHLSITLDDTRLSVFGQSSGVINDLCEYIDFYTRPDQTWISKIPFFGDTLSSHLKKNRFNKMTIDTVVSSFADQIKNASQSISNTINYCREVYKRIQEVKDTVEADLMQVSDEIKNTVDINYSRFNTLNNRPKELLSDEDANELWIIQQNISILQGTKTALEVLIKSLDMKKEMFKRVIDSGIRFQNKAKQCESLPNILQSMLDIMRITQNMSNSALILENTEKIVGSLVNGASDNTNHLVAQSNQIKDLSLNFNQIITQLKDVKNDCDQVINTISYDSPLLPVKKSNQL